MTDPRRTRAYQSARAKFLASRAPVCYWCGQPVDDSLPKSDPRKATVDHLIEVDSAPALGMDTSTWVVACLRCNSFRGAQYRNRRDRGPDHRTPTRDW